MSITITELQPKDNLGKSRVDINNNFTTIKEEIESLQGVLDPATANISASNLEVSRGARAISTEIVNIDGSQRIKGDEVIEGSLTVSNVTISSNGSLIVPNGSASFTGSESSLSVEGDFTCDGNIILKDYNNTAIDASNIGSYTSVSSNIGTIVPNGKHALILDFSNYSSSANVENTHTVRDLKLDTGVHQGQILELTVLANSSAGKPHYLMSNNIISLGSSEKLEFDADYCSVTLRYSGNSWIIRNTFKANIV